MKLHKYLQLLLVKNGEVVLLFQSGLQNYGKLSLVIAECIGSRCFTAIAWSKIRVLGLLAWPL